jgi:hypothetical protein
MTQHKDSTSPFPETVYEFGRTANLGVPLAEHRWGLTCLEFMVIPLVGSYAILSLWMIWGIIFPGTLGWGPEPPSPLILIVVVAIMVPCFWYFFELFRRFSSWRVYVFTNGFAYFKGSKIERFRWEEVRHIEGRHTYINWSSTPTLYAYWIEHADGHRVLLNSHLRGIAALAGTITQQTNAARMLEAQRRYRAGEEIAFGLVKISQQGLRQGSRLLPWTQVKEITLEKGYVYIRSKEGGWSSWAPIPAASFPNVSIFMTLVRETLNQST